ncbi:MAG: CHASE2 domain-containing protein [Candidatus Rokubacteria bacterium]|nr:CHASE2 domain-containing protein [Candidatus Rokubacteria bacterium]
MPRLDLSAGPGRQRRRRAGLEHLLRRRARRYGKAIRLSLQGSTARLWFRGLALGLAIALASVLGFLEGVERWGLNMQFHLRGPRPPQTPIVIVSIDEDSFDELNLPWPWPRALHAEFLDIVSRGRPAVIGLDLLFAEPSSFGPDDDVALAEAVARVGNVVLPGAMTVVRESFYSKVDLNPPLPSIRRGAAGFGPVNFYPDDDAFVRWAHLSQIYQGQELSHFDLHLYRLAVKAGMPSRPFGGSSFLINYRGGPRTFPTVPYYRILNGEVGPQVFTGRIVLVGATSPVLHDVFPTPFATQGNMPGVEIHANVLETLFQGIPIQRVPWPLKGLLALAGGVLAVWITNRMRPLHALGVVVVAGSLSAGVGFAAFVWGRLWLDVAPVPASLLIGYVATVVENFIQEQREKRRLSRFFSPAVVKEIVRHKDDVNLGSTRRRMTVLFSDIRGFTSMSEKMAPEEVVTFLREYLTEMTEAVFKHGGTVDKYIGDAIMALYNVPFYQPDHAERAVRTALEFQQRLRPLAARFHAKYGGDLRCGVGVNTGDAVVGTIGAEQRLEYTAIGDAINLGSRLESVTKDFKVSIVISESTYQEVQGQFVTRYLGEVRVKGKEIPVKIYEVAEADARRELRLPMDTSVTISDGEISVLASVSDLSLSGMAARGLPKQFAEGQVVDIRLELPALPQPVDVKGEVSWSVEDRAGFRFLEIKPADQAAIAELVSGRGAPAPEA